MKNQEGKIAPRVLARVEGHPLGIEATLFVWATWHVTLLTTKDPREVVGIEIMPIAEAGSWTPEVGAAWSKRWTARLDSMRSSDAGGTPVPVPTAIPTVDLLAALEQFEGRSTISAATEWIVDYLDSARDAWIYSSAVARGESAARAVADQRGITVRSAEGRIRRARQRGYLSTPVNTRSPSMLTESAAEQIEAVSGERPYPYVTKDGVTVLGPT